MRTTVLCSALVIAVAATACSQSVPVAVILDGKGGYEPGNISRRVTKGLSGTQWGRVVAALDEARFWQMTTGVRDIIGIDGAQWIIEARRNGRYHVVSRYAAADGTREIGDVFLDLAGLDDASLRRAGSPPQ